MPSVAATRAKPVRHQRRAHLDLEEHPEHSLASPAGIDQFREHRFRIEAWLLALREELHRGAGVRLAEAELAEDAPSRSDVLLGHAAVGLRDVPHDRECGAEECRAHRREARTRPGARPRRTEVVDVPHDEADQHADRPSGQHIAQECADQLAGPDHAAKPSFLDRPERAMLASAPIA
jgi:hypothetical protein